MNEIQKKIRELAKEKNAVILVHNYQKKEVQEIADILGDSLVLSKKAAETKADIIVFCGVTFMAETAKILSPEKKVLIPRFDAGCPMANMITYDELKKIKEEHKNQNIKVVAYVNTNADVKSISDVCCTSSNAKAIVENIDADKIIFVPDKNLGSYCKQFTKKEMFIYDGFCYVHNQITPDKIKLSKQKHPNAIVIAHPECPIETLNLSDKVLSTEGMINFIEKSESNEFIIATEPNIIFRLEKEIPNKKYYPTENYVNCKTMQLTELEDVYNALKNEVYEIKLDEDIINLSKKSLNEMLKYI